MTDNEFNLEFNKKLLYYRENVVATVYITTWAKISFAFAVTYTQLMHDVYIHLIWKGGNSFNRVDIYITNSNIKFTSKPTQNFQKIGQREL